MTFNLENLKVTEGQKALAAYIKRETGKVVKPESIALVEALRAEFRKDPAQVAARESVKAAARARKEEALEKALEKARRLAESLGLNVPTVEQQRTVAAVASATPAPVVDDDFDEEEVASVTPISAAKSRREPTPADPPDTSAIVVTETVDGWATDGETEPEDEDF